MTIETSLGLMIRYMLLKADNNDIDDDDLDAQLDNTTELLLVICLQSTTWLDDALGLLVNGVAEPETVDKTWRFATGAPLGPLKIRSCKNISGKRRQLLKARFFKRIH